MALGQGGCDHSALHTSVIWRQQNFFFFINQEGGKYPPQALTLAYSTEKRSLPGCIRERALDSGSRVFSCPHPLKKTYLPTTRALISLTFLVITKYLIRSDAGRRLFLVVWRAVVNHDGKSWAAGMWSRLRSRPVCSKEAKKDASWCPAYLFLLLSLYCSP